MPDLPISALPPATFVGQTDLFVIVQGGITKNAQKLNVLGAAPGEPIGLTGAAGSLLGIDAVGNIFLVAGAGKTISLTPFPSLTLAIGDPITGSSAGFILLVDAMGQLDQAAVVPTSAGGFGTDSSVALIGQVPVADGVGGWSFVSAGPLSIGNAILLSSPQFVLFVDASNNLGEEQYLSPVRGGLGIDASTATAGQVPVWQPGGGFLMQLPGGSSPIQCWCYFAVSGGAIASFQGSNIASVTYNSVGNYTVNFSSALPTTFQALWSAAGLPAYFAAVISPDNMGGLFCVLNLGGGFSDVTAVTVIFLN